MSMVFAGKRADEPSMQFRTRGFESVFWFGFVVFLPLVLISRLLPRRWRWSIPGAEGNRSVIEDTKTAVYTFMSCLP